MSDPQDVFGQESRPSISFKDAPVGTSYTGVVVEAPKMVQSRDFESGEPAFWPDGNPKMSAVLGIRLPDGEERSVWAAKPSNLFSAFGAAQKAAGERITEGGTITITLTGEKPNERNPRLNPAKIYAVTYRPGAPADPWEEPAPAPAQAVPAVHAAPRDLKAMIAEQVAAEQQQAAAAPPAPPAAPGALLEQIRTLISVGMTDAQIAAVPPLVAAGVDMAAVAAVRATAGV